MNNPFDEVIRIQDNREEHIETPNPSPQKKVTQKKHINISFSLNRDIIERGIFSVIIIILLVLIFVNSGLNCSSEMGKLTGAAIANENRDVIRPITKETNTQKEPIITKNDEKLETTIVTTEGEAETEAEEEEEEEEIQVTEKPFKTNFDFSIENIDFDKNDDGNPSRMNSIKIVMNNRWKNFKPKIIVYWFDSGSSDAIKEKKRTVMQYREIKQGTTVKYTIQTFDSSYFDPSNSEETIQLDLYDSDSGLLMKSIDEVIR